MTARQPFGTQLRRFRVRRGWSQRTLADRSGVNAGYISLLERGYRTRGGVRTDVDNPSERVVRDLADTLELPPEDRQAFFAVAGYPGRDLPPPIRGLTGSAPVGDAADPAVRFGEWTMVPTAEYERLRRLVAAVDWLRAHGAYARLRLPDGTLSRHADDDDPGRSPGADSSTDDAADRP